MTESRRPAANDNDPAFTMSRAEFQALVGSAVQQAMLSTSAPLLVDKQDLARQLGCSPAHIDHLRKRGLPTVPVGKVVRFEPAKVLEWLRAQKVGA